MYVALYVFHHLYFIIYLDHEYLLMHIVTHILVISPDCMAVDDVFLWNFLTDSKAKQEWRLVLSYLVQKDASELDRLEAVRASHKDTCIAGMLRHLEFNEQVHQVLCSEVEACPIMPSEASTSY